MLEVQQSTVDMAGKSRLDQIRASMAAGEITSGQSGSSASGDIQKEIAQRVQQQSQQNSQQADQA
jgi:hypothetical protein